MLLVTDLVEIIKLDGTIPLIYRCQTTKLVLLVYTFTIIMNSDRNIFFFEKNKLSIELEKKV